MPFLRSSILFKVKAKIKAFKLSVVNAWYHALQWLIAAHDHYHTRRQQQRFRRRRRLSTNTITPSATHPPHENADGDEDRSLAEATDFLLRPRAQKRNIFCRLPKEIRLMIYEQCFDDCPNLHIEANVKHSRFGVPRTAYQIPPYTEKSPYKKKTDPSLRGYLSLPFTCRQMYTETIDLPFKCPKFLFEHPEDISGLRETILPHRWERITKIDLDYDFTYCDFGDFEPGLPKSPRRRRNLAREWAWMYLTTLPEWGRACRALASLPDLEHLQIGAWCELGHRWPLMPMLDPLMQITRPRHFEVRTITYPWGRCRLEAYQDAPFKLLFWVGNRSGRRHEFAARSLTAPYDFLDVDERNN